MLFIAHLCNHHTNYKVVVGLGAQLCTPLEVWVQVPMVLKHDPVTSSGKSAPGPDPRIRHRIQIGMFRPIRVDHTNCLQVAIKTHSFRPFPPAVHCSTITADGATLTPSLTATEPSRKKMP
jgi:hypothetical protein